MQSRYHSAIEACVSTAVGYLIAVAAQAVVFPLFGIHASHSDHFGIAAIFTGVSLVRGYLVRRAFNRWHMSQPDCRITK